MANKKTDYIKFFEAQTKANELLNSNKLNERKIGLYILVQIYTGLRYSDAIKLTYEDLLKESLTLKETKTKKSKQLPIKPEIKDAINKYFDVPTDLNTQVFTSNKGSLFGSSYLSQALKKHFSHLKDLEISTHSLRKAFGRRVWENNNKSEYSLALLQDIFNHTSIAVTKRYLGIRQDEINSVYLNL